MLALFYHWNGCVYLVNDEKKHMCFSCHKSGRTVLSSMWISNQLVEVWCPILWSKISSKLPVATTKQIQTVFSAAATVLQLKQLLFCKQFCRIPLHLHCIKACNHNSWPTCIDSRSNRKVSLQVSALAYGYSNLRFRGPRDQGTGARLDLE